MLTIDIINIGVDFLGQIKNKNNFDKEEFLEANKNINFDNNSNFQNFESLPYAEGQIKISVFHKDKTIHQEQDYLENFKNISLSEIKNLDMRKNAKVKDNEILIAYGFEGLISSIYSFFDEQTFDIKKIKIIRAKFQDKIFITDVLYNNNKCNAKAPHIEKKEKLLGPFFL